MNWYLILPVVFILVALAVIYFIWEDKNLKVRHYMVKRKNMGGSCRIAFLSDLHGNRFGNGNRRLLDAIQNEQPSIVLIGGDLVVGGEEADFQTAFSLVSALAEKYPVYYALGNHECKCGKEQLGSFMDSLRERGVVFLDNSCLSVKPDGSDAFRLCGLTLERDLYFRKFNRGKLDLQAMEGIIGKCGRDFKLLLAHNPAYFETYAAWGADLVLSGHLHGGMVRLPFVGGCISPGYFLFPKYAGGLYEQKKRDGTAAAMIVSHGLGNHTIKIRFMNPPELVVVDLVPEKTGG